MSLEVNGELVPVGGGDPIPLLRNVLTIGRRGSCDIPMRWPNVSGLHAELTFRDGYWYIKDMGSTNGIKVNLTRVTQKLLHPGDQITIGKRHYTIEYTLAAGQRAMEEMLEDDIMEQSLLEKAGLAKPKRDGDDRRRSSRSFDPAAFLLEDDEDDR